MSVDRTIFILLCCAGLLIAGGWLYAINYASPPEPTVFAQTQDRQLSPRPSTSSQRLLPRGNVYSGNEGFPEADAGRFADADRMGFTLAEAIEGVKFEDQYRRLTLSGGEFVEEGVVFEDSYKRGVIETPALETRMDVVFEDSFETRAMKQSGFLSSPQLAEGIVFRDEYQPRSIKTSPSFSESELTADRYSPAALPAVSTK